MQPLGDIRSFFNARENAMNAHAGSRFTDRSDYKDAFWKNLDMICLNPGRSRVLHFYGFGGVGKTMLCEELKGYVNDPSRREDREFCRIRLTEDWFSSRRIRAVYFSFEGQTDAPEVLKTLSAMLFDEYHILFRYFWFAYYRFLKLKRGEEPEPLFEQKRLDESTASELLTGFTDMVSDFIPFGNFIKLGVNLGVKAVGAIGAGVSRASEKGDPRLSDIQNMSEEELKEMLPAFFALDFSLFRETQQKKQGYVDPVVIILDTFEQLTNALYEAQSARVSDAWLWETRGQPGIIPFMTDCLWIIAGQRKIEWGRRDPEHWTDAAELPEEEQENALIESHLLGNLAREDADEFLIKSGVDEPPIRQAIIDHTEGIPIWLDFYVDVYRSIEGEKNVEEFRLDEKKLADRFIGNLRGVKRDMLECMVLLRRWSVQEVEKMRSAGLIQSQDTFSWLLGLSFFNDNGEYVRIHDKVYEVLAHSANRGNRMDVYRYVCTAAADRSLPAQDRVFRIAQKLTLRIREMEEFSDEKLITASEEFFEENGELLEYLLYEKADGASALKGLEDLLESRGISCPGRTILALYLFCFCMDEQDTNKAAEYLAEVRDLMEGDGIGKLRVRTQIYFYRRMSSFSGMSGNKGEALICKTRAFSLSEALANREELIHAATDLADAYDKIGNIKAAGEYIEYALSRDDRSGEPVTDRYLADIVWIRVMQARQAMNREDYEETKKYLALAKDELDGAGDHGGSIGNARSFYLSMCARLSAELGDDKQAEEYHLEALAVMKDNYERKGYYPSRRNMCVDHTRLADFYSSRDRKEEARQHLEAAIAILEELLETSPDQKQLGRYLTARADLIDLKDEEEQIPLLEKLVSEARGVMIPGVDVDFKDLIQLRRRLFYRYLRKGDQRSSFMEIVNIEQILEKEASGWSMKARDGVLFEKDFDSYLKTESRRRAKKAVEYRTWLQKKIQVCGMRRRYYQKFKEEASREKILANLKQAELYAREQCRMERDVDAVTDLCLIANGLSRFYKEKDNYQAALPYAREDHALSKEIFERHSSRANYRSLWISQNMLVDVEAELGNWEEVTLRMKEKASLIERMWKRDAQPEDLERLTDCYEDAVKYNRTSRDILFDLTWFQDAAQRCGDRDRFFEPALARMGDATRAQAEEQYDKLMRAVRSAVIGEIRREGADDANLLAFYMEWIDLYGMIHGEPGVYDRFADNWDLFMDRQLRRESKPDPELREKLRREMTEASDGV